MAVQHGLFIGGGGRIARLRRSDPLVTCCSGAARRAIGMVPWVAPSDRRGSAASAALYLGDAGETILWPLLHRPAYERIERSGLPVAESRGSPGVAVTCASNRLRAVLSRTNGGAPATRW